MTKKGDSGGLRREEKTKRTEKVREITIRKTLKARKKILFLVAKTNKYL